MICTEMRERLEIKNFQYHSSESSILSDKWHGKPYYSLNAYLKNTYGKRIKKISINGGFTCPNRDGTLDTRGCIFCSAGGSGDFAIPWTSMPGAGNAAPHFFDTSQQTCIPMKPESSIVHSVDKLDKVKKAKQNTYETIDPYIAYFQAYTCTYAPVPYLNRLYRHALDNPAVMGISIATRPDCLPEDVLSLLSRLKENYPGKFIWVELGLQTIHEQTARYIRRGYPSGCFSHGVKQLHQQNIPVIAHVILGLPGENKDMMLQTIDYINSLPVAGIKLQLLHVLKGTDLAKNYHTGEFSVLSMDDYLTILIACICRLSPDIVIHRLTGDGPKELLIAPLWSRDKKRVLNGLHKRMELENAYQGKNYKIQKGTISHEPRTPNPI